MNLVELDTALRKLRLSGMADVLEAACARPPTGGSRSTSSRRWSATDSCAARTA